MEHYDAEMARRVWQRVWGEAPAPGDGIQGLLLAESQAAADYGSLQRRIPELKPLLEQTRQHIACLRGISYLTTGSRPGQIPIKPREETLDAHLRRCFGQSLKTAAAYRSRTEDTEYGHIFSQMAEQKHRHCRVILEIIGKMNGK